MAALNEKYVINDEGKRVGVLLDWEEYQRLLEELEELAAIRAYDAAKASGGEVVHFEQAIEGMEGERG